MHTKHNRVQTIFSILIMLIVCGVGWFLMIWVLTYPERRYDSYIDNAIVPVELRALTQAFGAEGAPQSVMLKPHYLTPIASFEWDVTDEEMVRFYVYPDEGSAEKEAQRVSQDGQKITLSWREALFAGRLKATIAYPFAQWYQKETIIVLSTSKNREIDAFLQADFGPYFAGPALLSKP